MITYGKGDPGFTPIDISEAQEFRRKKTIRAVQQKEPFQVMTINGNLARGEAGDYLAQGEGPDDLYPIKRNTSTYTRNTGE